jgi:hypothetical protein
MNVYDWMCVNADKVVAAVREDGGKLDGPTATPLLEEAFRQYAPGRSRDKARELLKIKLDRAGFKGLLS